MGYATVEGRNIHYLYPQEAEAGVKKGCTVLLIHGAYENHRVWSVQYHYLEREHTPISVDLPGHGDSEGPGINSAAVFRKFIKAFVDLMGLAPFIFCGHSMGGSMALDYALHYPETLKGLILIGSAPEWSISPAFPDIWKKDPEKARSKTIDYLFSKKTPAHIIDRYDEQLRTTAADVCLADAETCASYDLSRDLHKIGLPTLVIHGDETTWIEGSRTIYTSLPCSSLVIVPAAGHAVMMEQPDQLNAAIGQYLGTLS